MRPDDKPALRSALNLIQKRFINQDDNIVEKRNKYISELKKIAYLMGEFDVSDPDVLELIDNEYLTQPLKPVVYEYDYKPWLNEVRGRISFDFYDRYERYLRDIKQWDHPAMASINSTTDSILDHLINPETKKLFLRKGLVLGDIQSGKTANYTALINKALDVGYKLILVLAGNTNDLRKQTQLRLDREVLGYVTKEDATHGDSIGVAEINGSGSLLVDCLTYNDNKGDFKATYSTHALAQSSTPKLAVIKKNKDVLENLLKYIGSSPSHCYTNNKLDIPVLIVDDEVDQASPNTKDIDAIEEASRINGLIRKIIDKCNRCAYVGYTATPFANIFINTDKDDLFPENFIITLPTPPGYSGIDDYFSINDDDGSEASYDLCVFVEDFDNFFKNPPIKMSASTQVDQLAGSLVDAITHFVIAASIKKARGIVEHNSMLVNIASVKCPATTLTELVKQKIEELYYEYKYEKVEQRYKEFWEREIKDISQKRLGESFDDKWEAIEPHIIKTYSNLFNGGVKLLNGDSKDVIDYESLSAGDWLIIGGNKLSRGLTLEGLIVSYFFRNSKQYDTLLQMGRWFGYRQGWLDLCRVYIDEQIVKSFVDIGIAVRELRADIDIMNDEEDVKTPREFGLKIRTSPKLVPTAKNKMRTAEKVMVSYSGRQSQILSFDPDYTEGNFALTDGFLKSIGQGIVIPNGKVVFKGIDAAVLVRFLSGYKEANLQTGTVEIRNWVNYIRKSNERDKLKKWTVVLSSLQERGNVTPGDSVEIGGYSVVKSKRSDRDADSKTRPSVFKLRVNTNPYDFRDAFYDIPEMSGVSAFSAEDARVNKYFTEGMGVISIQVTDICYKEPTEFKNNKQYYKPGSVIEDGADVVGLTIWFPKSADSSFSVEYYTNKVWQDNEYKASKRYFLDDEEV